MTPPPPPPPPQVGWLPRLLTDPAGAWHTLTEAALAYGLPAGVALAALAATAVLLRRRLRAARCARMAASARTIEILTPPEVAAEAAELFWAQMTGLLRPPLRRLLGGQPHLGWEWVFTPAGTAIRLWVPGPVPPGMVERAVAAAWPGARTTTGPARDPLPPGVAAAGGRLALARADVLPLRAAHRADPAAALLGAAGDLAAGEAAAVQVLARPATGGRLARARRDAAAHRGHHSPTLTARLLALATPRPARTPHPAGASPAAPEVTAASRAIGAKAIQPRWAVTLTYAAAHTRALPAGRGPAAQAARQSARRRLRGRAHALASAYAVYTGHNYLHRTRLAHPAAALAARRLGRGQLLAVDELAALAHLPAATATPGLARAGAAAVPPPAGTPTRGPQVKPLGDADAGHPRPVGITTADARHHLHILGATGSGKSTLLANLALADAAAGRGVVVIDPKGDLAADILARLPAATAPRLALLDPDQAHPPCLNILDGADPDLATDQLVSIFRRIWADSWGPRSEDLLRAACLTLLHTRTRPPAAAPTLLDVAAVLTDPASRQHATAAVTDPVLAGFWAWYAGLSEAGRASAAGPVLNKLRALLLRRFARQTLAAGPSTIDLARTLDAGGVLLARLPKGALGEDASRIVGSVVLAKVWQAALTRARRPAHARPDAAVYLDEAQNFLTLPGGVEDMLAEARGYHVSLTLAHQNLRQLPADLADALAANARSKIFFACSPKDAAALAPHTAPTVGAHDLAHLPAFTAAARLVVHATDTPAHTIRTRPLPPAVPGRAEALRAAAHATATAAATAGRPAAGDPRAPTPTASNPGSGTTAEGATAGGAP